MGFPMSIGTIWRLEAIFPDTIDTTNLKLLALTRIREQFWADYSKTCWFMASQFWETGTVDNKNLFGCVCAHSWNAWRSWQMLEV